MRTQISADDIKKVLFNKHKKIKSVVIVSSLIAVISAVFDILLLFFSQIVISESFSQLRRGIMIIICTVFLILMFLFIVKYLLTYYKIKKSRFTVITERLYHKSIEDIVYYKRIKSVKVFYFKSGRIFVDDLVYKNSAIGDEFYLIMLDDKAPYYIYSKKQYKIDM